MVVGVFLGLHGYPLSDHPSLGNVIPYDTSTHSRTWPKIIIHSWHVNKCLKTCQQIACNPHNKITYMHQKPIRHACKSNIMHNTCIPNLLGETDANDFSVLIVFCLQSLMREYHFLVSIYDVEEISCWIWGSDMETMRE